MMFLMLIINIILLIRINPLLIITFFIYVMYFILLNNVLFKGIKYRFLNIFFINIFFTIMIYLYQLNNLPSQLGFSGDGVVIGGGYGTDDSYFYSRAIDYYSTYLKLPENYPLRWGSNFYKYVQEAGFDFYSWFLSRFVYIIEIYKKVEPLDVIFINALFQSFLPIFTLKISNLLFKNKKIGKISFYLTLFSPILVAHGLVLVRDGLAATFFMGMLYYFFKKEKKWIVFLGILALIRGESGLQGIIALGIICFFRQKNNNKKIILLFLIGIIVGIIVLLYKDKMIKLTGGSLFYRKNYVEKILANNGAGKAGGIYKIQQLNIIFRIPLSMIAFLISPLFSIEQIYKNGIFIIRWFILYFIYPIINLFCIGGFIKGICDIFYNKNLKLIFVSFLFLLFFVSQYSFQSRHVTLYMPLYYIICSYGIEIKKKNKVGNVLASIATGFYILINILKM